MRAVVVRSYGGPEALEVADVPVPEPGRGQVRIRVAAAAVNPVDTAIRQGLMNVARPGVIREREQVGIGWFELRQRASGVSAWIFDIRLDEDRRGQGLGRALLEALHDAARGLGATSMTLNVFGDNATAIRLYETSGYTVTAQQMRRDL